MGNPVVHFEVLAEDQQKADDLQEFYGQVFDWKIDAGNPMKYGVVDTGVAPGGGIGADGSGEGMSGVTFYVEVPDLTAALEKVESLSGKTLMPPMDVPGGPQLALFTDPQGYRVGLVKGE